MDTLKREQNHQLQVKKISKVSIQTIKRMYLIETCKNVMQISLKRLSLNELLWQYTVNFTDGRLNVAI